jgi:hypothetical protein
MGIEFVDPEEDPQTPELVKFKHIMVQAYPDGRRVRIGIEINASLQNPDIEIEVYSPDGERVANASVVEMGNEKLNVTLHMRGEIHPGKYLCKLDLSYRDTKVVDSREVAFSVLEADNHNEE